MSKSTNRTAVYFLIMNMLPGFCSAQSSPRVLLWLLKVHPKDLFNPEIIKTGLTSHFEGWKKKERCLSVSHKFKASSALLCLRLPRMNNMMSSCLSSCYTVTACGYRIRHLIWIGNGVVKMAWSFAQGWSDQDGKLMTAALCDSC